MYEQYFGFTEKPFSLTPDPKYLYKSESHASAYELLQYAIRRREGFVVITGDIGTGKTTLCRALLEQIDRKTFTALVLNPFLSEDDLLKLILQDFGVVSREEVRQGRLRRASKQDLVDLLYDFLLALLPRGESAVLIIDEAQNLPLKVLEQIRILSNLETDKDKLLQILLVGQLNLVPLLRSPELRQLDQRVSIRYQLQPLTRDEVAAYVAHRLTIGGGSGAVSFTAKALRLIHRYSGGIPRLVNLICDRALLGAYSIRTSKITPDLVLQGAENLELAHAKPRGVAWGWRGSRAVLAAAGAASVSVTLAAVGVGHYYFWSPANPGDPPVHTTRTAPPAVATLQQPPAAAATNPAATDAQPQADVAPVGDEADRHQMPDSAAYTILVGSFPIRADRAPAERGTRNAPDEELSRDSAPGSLLATTGRVASLTQRLETLQYRVYHAEVDLGARGRWRRVLVGAYTSLDDARRDEARLRLLPEFADAQVIAAGFAATARQ